MPGVERENAEPRACGEDRRRRPREGDRSARQQRRHRGDGSGRDRGRTGCRHRRYNDEQFYMQVPPGTIARPREILLVSIAGVLLAVLMTWPLATGLTH